MKVKLRISLANDQEESFMGIGLVWLLKGIRESKSISRAARDIKMSYSKAHRILKNLEKNLGEKILATRTGGVTGGGTELTPFAEKFVKKYDRYQEKIKNFAEKEFQIFWEGL